MCECRELSDSGQGDSRPRPSYGQLRSVPRLGVQTRGSSHPPANRRACGRSGALLVRTPGETRDPRLSWRTASQFAPIGCANSWEFSPDCPRLEPGRSAMLISFAHSLHGVACECGEFSLPKRREGPRPNGHEPSLRPERLELPTPGSEDRCSIQLSYGRRLKSSSKP